MSPQKQNYIIRSLPLSKSAKSVLLSPHATSALLQLTSHHQLLQLAQLLQLVPGKPFDQSGELPKSALSDSKLAFLNMF